MKQASSARAQTSPVLPIPASVARHHLETLRPWTESWRSQGRVPPVMLLTGIEGVGKRSIGYWLSQWLLCEHAGFSKPQMSGSGPSGSPESDAGADLFGGGLFGADPAPAAEPAATSTPAVPTATDGPCGECRSCKKALQATWVDFREIGAGVGAGDETDSDDDEGVTSSAREKLKIDVFRDLKSQAGFGSHEGSFRIFLIRNAERMTPQAANSLLKLLEEPPASWIFILTASDSSLLLPTVVSRCQRIRLKPFGESTLSKVLAEAGIPKDRADLALSLAQGSWKKALTLAEDLHREKRESVQRFLENPPENLNPVLEWASAGVDSLALLLDLLEPMQLELLRRASVATSIEAVASRPLASFLTSHLKYVSFNLRTIDAARAFWMERSERLAKARHEITLPLNKKLLAQEILLPYLLS